MRWGSLQAGYNIRDKVRHMNQRLMSLRGWVVSGYLA